MEALEALNNVEPVCLLGDIEGNIPLYWLAWGENADIKGFFPLMRSSLG
ncbi:hypothetical protein [Paenibacillus typhae]|nr:hypothetical protein [Paenibacillus typhae]